jgi:hypothetical protein
MTKSWLSYVNLSESYTRKARFLPGVIAVTPLLPLSAAFGAPLLNWLELSLAGAGIGAILAVALSHLASAAGNRLQQQLWPDWPHDAPTNRWLHPDDVSVSSQQKQRCYRAIKRTVNLDIQAAIDKSNPVELKAIINDSVSALRNRLWQAPQAKRLDIHNTDYGFARNITGLRCVWGILAATSMVGCWGGYMRCGHSILWAVTATFVAAAASLMAVLLPSYVRKRAHYYAESFFEATVALSTAQKSKNPSKEG